MCLCLSISLITSFFFIHACLIPKTWSRDWLSVCITNASCRSVFCILHTFCLCWFYLSFVNTEWWAECSSSLWYDYVGVFFSCCVFCFCICINFLRESMFFCLLIDILLSYSRSSDLTFYMLITIWYKFTHFPNISYSFFYTAR